ncbi:helix-turn-helix domain-containing protein [Francisella philomiragia]|uniref:hypothetical protein n=1 Tax=Francisella philomiragia TaxID=28110 RepID=UPI002243C3B2|nr:hypothetical protein [Francisella philomiragia]
MERKDILNLFSKVTNISNITDKTPGAISQWEQNGVPADHQRLFYYATGGRLVPALGVPYVPIEEIQQLLKDKGE